MADEGDRVMPVRGTVKKYPILARSMRTAGYGMAQWNGHEWRDAQTGLLLSYAPDQAAYDMSYVR